MGWGGFDFVFWGAGWFDLGLLGLLLCAVCAVGRRFDGIIQFSLSYLWV